MGSKRQTSALKVWLSGASTLLLMGFVSCEEEPVARRTPVRRARAAAPVVTDELAKYTSPGNGLQVAPDWIKSLDPNMMRRSNQPLEGFRLGHAIKPSALIERGEMGWRLVLVEDLSSDPTQTMFKGQRVEIPFKGAPTSLYKQSGRFEEGDVEWSVPKSLTLNDLRPWKAETEYLLELNHWDVQPYDPQAGAFQKAGKASGRLMLRARDDLGAEGWVVGRFDEILVRYIGDPSLWETAHP